MSNRNNEKSLIVYESEDGRVSFEVKVDRDTVWLTQAQMGELFGKDRKTITEHIRNIYREKELSQNATSWNFQQVRFEGKRKVSRNIEHYNLDIIISVGYRVVRHEAVA